MIHCIYYRFDTDSFLRYYDPLFYDDSKVKLRSKCPRSMSTLWCVDFPSDRDFFMKISCLGQSKSNLDPVLVTTLNWVGIWSFQLNQIHNVNRNLFTPLSNQEIAFDMKGDDLQDTRIVLFLWKIVVLCSAGFITCLVLMSIPGL
jgi:hypothetical protein